MQNVSHLLFEIVPVDEGTIGCGFRVPTQPARIQQASGPLIFLSNQSRNHTDGESSE